MESLRFVEGPARAVRPMLASLLGSATSPSGDGNENSFFCGVAIQPWRLCASYVYLAERRPYYWLLGPACLALAALVPVSSLSLRTDFTELLPETHPAAVAIREVMPRQLSSTNLVLIIESPDRAANRRFAEALRPKLQRLCGTLFSSDVSARYRGR